MNRSVRVMASVAAAALMAATATAALAQSTPSGQPSAEGWKARVHAHAEAKVHALHDLLNIHPDQEAAFQAFIASMHHDRDHDGAKPPGGPGEMAHLTTPERLDRMEARMAEHQSRMQAHIQAVKTFYAALTPEQQKAFDALPMVGFGHRGGHPGGWGGGRHGHWGGQGPHGPPPPPPPAQ